LENRLINSPSEDEYVPVNGAIMQELPNEMIAQNDPPRPNLPNLSKREKTTYLNDY
jgi:hypothetical protein